MELNQLLNQGGATAPQTYQETKYNTPQSAGADYSLPGRIANFFTGQNTRAENTANSLNQYLTEERQKEYNSAEAQKDRDWQTMMSNTAYQRAMADAEKAGINPYYVLQNGSGASTPGGATASATSKAPDNSQKNRGGSGNALGALILGIKLLLTATGHAGAAAGMEAAETAVKAAKEPQKKQKPKRLSKKERQQEEWTAQIKNMLDQLI